MEHETFLVHGKESDLYHGSSSMIEFLRKDNLNVIAGHGMRTGLCMMADGQDHPVYRLYEAGDRSLEGLYILVGGALQPR